MPERAFPADVALLPQTARLVAGLLRACARVSLLWMGAAVLLGDGVLQANTLAQIRTFAAIFLVPEAVAWCVMSAYTARASIEQGVLVLSRGTRRLELAVREIAAVEPWRLPVPSRGASLWLVSGARWDYGLAHVDAAAVARAVAAAGGASAQEVTPTLVAVHAQARLAVRHGHLDRPWVKFVLFPLLLAVPAFRLHQRIAYGSAFGEYYTFGLTAYLTTFAFWWAAWVIGVVLCAAALRAAIEAGTLLAVLLWRGRAVEARRWLECLGLAVLYLGLPTWLMLRTFGN